MSTSSPASSKLFLSPGPGLGFTGILSLACSGLPASVACSFAPSSVVMNGFSDMTDTVTFSKTSTAAVAHVASLRWTRALAGMSLVSVLLLVWPRKTRYARRAGLLLLLGCLAVSNGCGGGSSTTTTTSPPPVMTTYVVTVTASGGLGTSAVSHSVTLALTVQ